MSERRFRFLINHMMFDDKDSRKERKLSASAEIRVFRHVLRLILNKISRFHSL